MNTAILYQELPNQQANPPLQRRKKRRQQMLRSAEESYRQLRITLRDVTVLEALYTTRYLTVPQIQALFWRENRGGQFGQLKACQRRMRQLFEHELVRRIEPLIRYSEGRKPLIYALDKDGVKLLVHELGIDPTEIDVKPQPEAESNYPFLQHLLDTTEIWIAFTHAVKAAGMTLEAWRNERELKSEGMSDVIQLTDPLGRKHKAAVVPDALACLNCQGQRGLFFVEMDRRTVTVEPSRWAQRGWARKVRTYLAYFESAAYQKRYGAHVAHVLTITTGQKRLAHLKQATEQIAKNKRFWFTTFDQATNPTQLVTQPIWARAGSEELWSLTDPTTV